MQVKNMIKNNILKQRISRLRNKLLKQGLYPGVVNRLLFKKVRDGEFPEEANEYIKIEKKHIKKEKKDIQKKKWSMSKDSIAWGLSQNR